MPMISVVGRKSLKVRALVFAIYACLIGGSVTMLYPFLLMIAGSTKSAVDMSDSRVIPPYLCDREALYQKHVEALFNESVEMMKVTYGSDAPSFLFLPEPEWVNEKAAAEWEEFCAGSFLPVHAYMIGEVYAPLSRGVLPYRLRRFKRQIIGRFDGDLDRMNSEMGTEFANWNAFRLIPRELLLRRNNPGMQPIDDAFRKFRAEQPVGMRYYFSAEGYYKVVFLQSKYGKDIERYNREHGTSYVSWGAVHLDRSVPSGPGRTDRERADWELFTREILNLLWLRADTEAAPDYQAFLRAKYGLIQALNKNYASEYASFSDVPLVGESPAEGLRVSDWNAFFQGWEDPATGRLHILPIEHVRVHSVDFMFRDYLKRKYGTVPETNRSLGTEYASWMDVLPPQADSHLLYFLNNAGRLRWQFTIRNYVTVVDYMVLHGRGIFNTAVYCSLAVLAALIVNPLAAYALCRYKPPSTYKVLLFLMLTMAFPPMVTQIPAFLMLREFHLLNTFWALILPGLANGYLIFLLKGFFDSLPHELYESAQIDGASEWTMFWGLTMSLSKPILAVIALNAFTVAYSNFMMALLICQDQRMWTLMPWLYQLQQYSGEGVVFASLLIACIPTFLVFALCQNIIMRGIIVPVEK